MYLSDTRVFILGADCSCVFVCACVATKRALKQLLLLFFSCFLGYFFSPNFATESSAFVVDLRVVRSFEFVELKSRFDRVLHSTDAIN